MACQQAVCRVRLVALAVGGMEAEESLALIVKLWTAECALLRWRVAKGACLQKQDLKHVHDALDADCESSDSARMLQVYTTCDISLPFMYSCNCGMCCLWPGTTVCLQYAGCSMDA